MFSSSIFLILAALIAIVSSATDYCDPEVCTIPGNPVYPHIGCNADKNLGPSCPSDAKYIQLTAEHKKIILEEHNKLRNNIAGGGQNGFNTASRMSTLKWNDEFEYLASVNVRRCLYQHDQCHNINGIKFAGQNLYTMGTSGNLPDVKSMVASAIKNWYSEVVNATQANIDKCCNSQYTIGHFTQVVSDLANEVGCGLVTYTQNGFKNVEMACDYSRTNLPNQSVYKSGAPASECKTGKNPKYPNLCSEKEMPDPNTFLF
jgi:hypothetical protein